MKTLAFVILGLTLASCTIERLTVRGKFGDYSFTPRRAVIIDTK